MKGSAPVAMRELPLLLLAAALGGAAGSACRAGASAGFTWLELPEWSARIAVNVAGAFLAGLIVTRMAVPEAGDPLDGIGHRPRLKEHLLVTGFLGGLTTVSGFAWDAAALMDGRAPDAPHAVDPAASLHLAQVMASNAVVGIAAAVAGVLLGRWMLRTGVRPRTLRA